MSYNPQDSGAFLGAKWQVAYLARELRHNKQVAFSCTQDEADMYFKELSSFYNSQPIMKSKQYKPGTKEVFIEIANAF